MKRNSENNLLLFIKANFSIFATKFSTKFELELIFIFSITWIGLRVF